jgi:transposase
MIVTPEATNVGHDRTQLSSMSKQTRDAIGVEKLTALADRGYFKAKGSSSASRLA